MNFEISRAIMKRLSTFVILSVALLCNVNAQDRPSIRGDQHLPSNSAGSLCDEIKSFITKMYTEKLYEDYDFLQKHCSTELLKKLQDAYPYDTDGIAYATWLFRSEQQDSKPGTNGKSCMLEVKADKDNWYIYRAIDMGWEFTKRIKVSTKDGKIVISNICPIED